ncbi:hypothetical protein BDK92_0368 [Micromonospora pisi]|uniref:General stress protein 17M-like domain-containing protein n=1 Tax=Micromonospora pisi TaxID=589240 RepID=A0A495JAV7_9ACTN|nr:general stress protein [Micromonospora pisi]RKR86146.1 hypothetical protein BDK92_0368 [Micromonospora pisi]
MTTPSTPGAGNLPPGPAGTPVPPSAGGAVPELAPPTVTVATYPDYAAAQRAVDYLSDSGFPVQHTAIVGTGLRLVENVIGRLTTGRAASAGAASGAWFGLFIGVLFGIFSSGSWVGVLIAAVAIGAVWGAIFGASAHAMTRGRRDFTSRSSLQAEQYAIAVEAEQAEQARQLLVRLNWRTSEAGTAG